jgi:glutathione S-transferase
MTVSQECAVSEKIDFYHNPQSRAVIVHWMLEEAGADYVIRPIDLQKGEHKTPRFRTINPMGKVPTIVVAGTVITETPAIIAWLADAYPQAKLAPPPGSPSRGSYYRWLFFGGSCIEPR